MYTGLHKKQRCSVSPVSLADWPNGGGSTGNDNSSVVINMPTEITTENRDDTKYATEDRRNRNVVQYCGGMSAGIADRSRSATYLSKGNTNTLSRERTLHGRWLQMRDGPRTICTQNVNGSCGIRCI